MSPTPSFDFHLYDWCFVTVFKSPKFLFVGVPPNIARRCGAAVDIRDGCGGNVETREEQNWEIPAACCELDFDALCSTLRMYDPAPLITFVQSLKHFLHKIHRASNAFLDTGFSNAEKSWLDSQFSLNLHFPMLFKIK
ncbi:hypothetical protein ILYODFUR_035848 [Ilyodon furcidens]|uniref:Uncharacterized protein n=1 Tax=Ilyodon furcidens TaxID=33524 RepID=A0ABV0T2Z6_9TELE